MGYIDNTAASKLVWVWIEVKRKIIVFAYDKGHKGGIGYFVKFIAYWDDKENKVQVYLLDCEASEGASADCAQAIHFSLTRLDATGFFLRSFLDNAQMQEEVVLVRVCLKNYKR